MSPTRHVIGIDISEKALKMAKKDFPSVKTMRMKLEDMEFGHKRFDLAICTRVLQHIPRENIDQVIKKICFSSILVYLDELTDTDGVPENKMMFKHDYEGIFKRNGFVVKERGFLGNQIWFLFSEAKES